MDKKSYESSIESLDRRIEQLRARRRDEVARHEKRERSARACACTAIGEAVLAWFGDWRELDPAAFRAALGTLDAHRGSLTASAPAGGAPSTSEALEAYRTMRRDVAESERPTVERDVAEHPVGGGL